MQRRNILKGIIAAVFAPLATKTALGTPVVADEESTDPGPLAPMLSAEGFFRAGGTPHLRLYLLHTKERWLFGDYMDFAERYADYVCAYEKRQDRLPAWASRQRDIPRD